MLVSIIIPTYNSLQSLREALRSIEAVDFPRDDFEVVVVDDGSADRTAEFLSGYAGATPLTFRYFRQPNRGPAAARNLAIRHAAGDYLLSIDADCHVDSNIINEYVKHFPSPGLAGVGGNVLPHQHTLISGYLDFLGVWRPGILEGDVKYLVTANAFFCKKAVLDVGGFDEDFRYPGGEEPEMCYRLKQAGYRFLYEPKALAIHAHRTDLKGMVRMFRTHGIGSRIGAEKWSDLRYSNRRIMRYLLEMSMRPFAERAFNELPPARAAAYVVFDYLRTLAYFYGYCLSYRHRHAKDRP